MRHGGYLRHATQRYFRAAGPLGWSFRRLSRRKGAAPDKPGYTLEKPEDLRKAFEEAIASKLPAVIDCKRNLQSRHRLARAPT
jgi:hypothetical protein